MVFSVGTALGVCGCCRVCAKGLNEKCGGIWNLQGRCGEGLKCVTKSQDDWQLGGHCERKGKLFFQSYIPI